MGPWGRSCAMHICSSTTRRLRPTLPRTKVEAAAFLCRLPSPCRPKTLGFLGFAPASSQQLAHSIYRTSSVNAAVRNLIFPPERFRARGDNFSRCLVDAIPWRKNPETTPKTPRSSYFLARAGPRAVAANLEHLGQKIRFCRSALAKLSAAVWACWPLRAVLLPAMYVLSPRLDERF